MAEFLTGLDLAELRLDLLGRMLLAAALGGVVGLEREWSGKPAGFRTNLLICVGAALLTELSLTIAAEAGTSTAADPARIAAQIVSGIGFLGAGTIIQSRGSVVGLTTAATLWVVAAVGMAVGAHAYIEAIGTTILVMVVLLLLGRLEPYMVQHVEHMLRITMDQSEEVQDHVEQTLTEHFSYSVVEIEREGDHLLVAYRVSGRRRRWDPLIARLIDLEGVDRVVRG